ncbi:hypothetical protein DVH24_013151 [Malus domestica]|uniref:Uncharacterized protein n=1 Tax=Malus domestica TaxID=3750 RepID=A0A498IKN4_MALDO|nr:hypothetical protein DVH24_013151 [Malus domestica]
MSEGFFEAIEELERMAREPSDVLEEMNDRLSARELQLVLVYFSQEGRDSWCALEVFEWLRKENRVDKETMELMVSIMCSWVKKLIKEEHDIGDVVDLLVESDCVGLKPSFSMMENVISLYWEMGEKEKAVFFVKEGFSEVGNSSKRIWVCLAISIIHTGQRNLVVVSTPTHSSSSSTKTHPLQHAKLSFLHNSEQMAASHEQDSSSPPGALPRLLSYIRATAIPTNSSFSKASAASGSTAAAAFLMVRHASFGILATTSPSLRSPTALTRIRLLRLLLFRLCAGSSGHPLHGISPSRHLVLYRAQQHLGSSLGNGVSSLPLSTPANYSSRTSSLTIPANSSTHHPNLYKK